MSEERKGPVVRETVDVTGQKCWIAEDPSMPDVYALGDSPEEARESFATARKAWLRLAARPVTTGNFEVEKAESITENTTRDGDEIRVERWGWPVTVARHAIAALALHGQPFGFTWADVDALMESPPDEPLLTEIADRIAALLPPREP